MSGVFRAVKDYNREATVVTAGYPDAQRPGSVRPLSVLYIADESGADGSMLDAAIKDGSALFDHLPPDSCRRFVSDALRFGLLAALADSPA
jgi:(5-formylfuran-3-yl)methyl phosphate synthase